MSLGHGYPAGTVCMITWCPWDFRLIGDQVEIVDSQLLDPRRLHPGTRPACVLGHIGSLPIQRITGKYDLGPAFKSCWPKAWMRPIDPDALRDDGETEHLPEEAACTSK